MNSVRSDPTGTLIKAGIYLTDLPEEDEEDDSDFEIVDAPVVMSEVD